MMMTQQMTVRVVVVAAVMAVLLLTYLVASSGLDGGALSSLLLQTCDRSELVACHEDMERMRVSTSAFSDLGACQSKLSKLEAQLGGSASSDALLPPTSRGALQLAAKEATAETLAAEKEIAQLKERVSVLEREKAAAEERLKQVEEAARQMEASVKHAQEETKNQVASAQLCPQSIKAARQVLGECNPAPGATTDGVDARVTQWKGYKCNATDAELQQYMAYEPRQPCPDDWLFVQYLLFTRDCFSLPRRRCRAPAPQQAVEPMPLPDSLFTQAALIDANVRWTLHECDSFECLNSRTAGDCRNCFNLKMEANRWQSSYRGTIPMEDVMKIKPSHSIRVGLDIGGGTGSFAAHMARYGVTVVTTAMNEETVYGHHHGLPYMETIALRGLVPLHLSFRARLPFFDNTFDLIHTVNSVKYLEAIEFEELIFDWDRVLRPGGLLWIEMFYAPVDEMPVYVAALDMLAYKRHYWNFTPKTDHAERKGDHVYLTCVLEKLVPPATGKPAAGA